MRGMIVAAGLGTRLRPFTEHRAKPAVPFGGAYRIIDFSLSNCLNSGLRKLLILTQFKSMSLDRHINLGWRRFFCRDLDEFLDIVPPQQRIDAHWYQGTADAVYQNLDIIRALRLTPGQVVADIGAGTPMEELDDALARHGQAVAIPPTGTVGGALAVSGMVYQATLRNPLADPFVLGINSGASLGVALIVLEGSVEGRRRRFLRHFVCTKQQR